MKNAPGALIHAIPEFSATQSIKIAPNTSVPVTDRLLAIIDSQTFQRLRAIRQLSLADRVFPSATHTRFSHALGVYHNVLDYLRHLDRFPQFHQSFDESDYLSVMLAGLLHDIGHYPCSHQLDHLEGFPKHEQVTIDLIEGRLSYEGEDLSAIIRREFGLDPNMITRFFRRQHTVPLLRQMIDSPIDADKCDYLPRDSYFCGVDYGTGFDRQRFITNLMPNREGNSLCMHEKGLLSAERFQLARYWMYRSVYWGHTVRALITTLQQCCRQLTKVPSHHELLGFNDHSFFEWLWQQSNGDGRELLRCIHGKRLPFKRVYTLAYNHDPDTYLKLQDESLRAQIIAKIKGGSSLSPHMLVWDVPPAYKTTNWETFAVRMNDGREVPIEHESPVIKALGSAFLQGVRKIRLFAHPATYQDLSLDRLPPIESLLKDLSL